LEGKIPVWIPDDEECDILLLRVLQDGVGVRLHHLAIGDDDGTAIVRFLLSISISIVCDIRISRNLYQDCHVDEQDGSIVLEVDAGGFADDVKAFDGDVCLI